MRSLVFVYCIFCLFPLAAVGDLEEFDEDFADLSELELFDSDDFLVTELRVEVADMMLDYLFGPCFLLNLLFFLLIFLRSVGADFCDALARYIFFNGLTVCWC